MSTPLKQRVLKEKKIICPTCGGALRSCKKGLICAKNHLFERDSEVFINIETVVTGIPRKICLLCDVPMETCECNKIVGGFMLRTRKLEYK